ncbi:MAG TPA: leucyl aminopeptidase family protein [Rhizomicrobium sp.]|nr:leucyl aminopeptidase family protein [Rhizomicrobium sp.]
MHPSLVRNARKAAPLYAVTDAKLRSFLEKRNKREAALLKASGFAARDNQFVMLPDASGGIAAAFLGLGKGTDPLAVALFADRLPAGTYRYAAMPERFTPELAALAWILGTYKFDRYRKKARPAPKLVVAAGAEAEEASRIGEAVFLARDLINTPANDMGPAELAAAARAVAGRGGAKFSETVGEALLKQNYPLIHAVGRGSARAPRLIDIRWGRAGAPKLTLVGKGVCFDTGGYDIKSSAGMFAMKKDMGGAAVCLALAQLVMDGKLDVRLRVLIPAVENSVSGTAYRPADVFPSRKGLTVEIGNTDAEGRLVLADALAEADGEAPDLLIDVATLTGAARTATGFELPPFFTDDEALAAALMRAGSEVNDPMWRLPLWRPYESALDSPVADLTNMPDYGYAGAITAALFLNRFVTAAKSWVHFDIAAWTDRPKPGRPRGAEATAARAIWQMLKGRFGSR